MEKARPKKRPNAQALLALDIRVLQGLTPEQRREVIGHLARMLLEATGSEGEADEEA